MSRFGNKQEATKKENPFTRILQDMPFHFVIMSHNQLKRIKIGQTGGWVCASIIFIG
ncbi:hypothetical protein BSM4216_1976 [Bacillus smithii]|nr:hypothetical protein BSM4216_1976 [Bacillus smithii]